MKLSFLFLLLISAFIVSAQKSKDDVYLFAYFKGNGEDGLHLALSNDGYSWQALKNDSSFLTPTAGKDKLMRDRVLFKGRMESFTWCGR